MRYQSLPSFDRLHELFSPNFNRGELTWKVSRGKAKRGSLAGFPNDRGYLYVGVDGRRYLVHRVMYALYHRQDPKEMEVDHIDLDKSDSRVANLRAATRAQNGQNLPGYRKGLKGAYESFKGQPKPWMATIQKDGVRHYLGSFATEREAHDAYIKASVAHHGDFGRTH